MEKVSSTDVREVRAAGQLPRRDPRQRRRDDLRRESGVRPTSCAGRAVSGAPPRQRPAGGVLRSAGRRRDPPRRGAAGAAARGGRRRLLRADAGAARALRRDGAAAGPERQPSGSTAPGATWPARWPTATSRRWPRRAGLGGHRRGLRAGAGRTTVPRWPVSEDVDAEATAEPGRRAARRRGRGRPTPIRRAARDARTTGGGLPTRTTSSRRRRRRCPRSTASPASPGRAPSAARWCWCSRRCPGRPPRRVDRVPRGRWRSWQASSRSSPA